MDLSENETPTTHPSVSSFEDLELHEKLLRGIYGLSLIHI